MKYEKNLTTEDFIKKEYLKLNDGAGTCVDLETITNLYRRDNCLYFDAVTSEGKELKKIEYCCKTSREAHSYYQKLRREGRQ